MEGLEMISRGGELQRLRVVLQKIKDFNGDYVTLPRSGSTAGGDDVYVDLESIANNAAPKKWFRASKDGGSDDVDGKSEKKGREKQICEVFNDIMEDRETLDENFNSFKSNLKLRGFILFSTLLAPFGVVFFKLADRAAKHMIPLVLTVDVLGFVIYVLFLFALHDFSKKENLLMVKELKRLKLRSNLIEEEISVMEEPLDSAALTEHRVCQKNFKKIRRSLDFGFLGLNAYRYELTFSMTCSFIISVLVFFYFEEGTVSHPPM